MKCQGLESLVHGAHFMSALKTTLPRLVTAIVLFGALQSANSQTTTATLFGVIRDTSGAVMSGAKITATNTATSIARTASSDATGAYLITNLPVGPYSFLVEKEGFRRFVQGGITLDADQNARVDAALEVGALTESVTVSSDAIGVDTRQATVGGVVDRERVQELPLNGRNVMQLANIIPGVTGVSAPTLVTLGRNGPQASVAGGRNTENEIRFDDSSNVQLANNSALNLPSPDALQEFTVLTNNFTAEYGQYGGGVFIAVTRAGTNTFHGSLWEYLRNTAFDARNFFSATKPDLKQNQFGFTLGGPVKRNRTFFFGSYQGTRVRQSQVLSSATPPSEAQRGGDFSASSTKPKDPLNNAPFPGAIIPPSRFDPTAVALLNAYIPLPNAPNGAYVALSPEPSTGDQYLWRIDHAVSAKNSLNVRYFRNDASTTSQSGNILDWSPNPQGLIASNYTLHDTHTFSGSLLTEFHIGVNRSNSAETASGNAQLSDYGAIFPGVVTPQLPSITVTGYFAPATADRYSEVSNIYQVGDTVRWFHGRHTVAVGGEFSRREYFGRGSSSNQGVISFGGAITGDPFADYLIGKPTGLTQNSTYDRLVKGYEWYLFAQDDIRLSPTVSLSLGLRYEYVPPFHNIYDVVNAYRAGEQSTVVPSAPLGMIFPGDSGFVPKLIPADKNDFGPRVGIVWDPSGNGHMAVRASYGLFHEDFRADLWTYPAVNQPFVISDTINDPYSLTDMYHGYVDPFPYVYSPSTAKFNLPMSLFTVLGPQDTTPYIHQLSFSVEHSLPSSIVLKAGYSGKLAHNLLTMQQKNPAVYIPGASTVGNTDQRRILAAYGYGSFREIDTDAGATYHSFQLTVNKRLTKGFTVLGSYTFSKLLDYFAAQTLAATAQNPYNLRADRGLSDNNRTQVFNMSIVYQLPEFGHGLERRVVGGWELASTTSMTSGAPFNITTGVDASLTGVGNDRPNVVANPFRSYSSENNMLQAFFNTAAFVSNLPGQYGDAGRNVLVGPSQATTDLAVAKSFPVSDRLGKVQLRAEFYNALNHANFNAPTAGLNNRNFGRILSAGSARILQFSLRYTF